MALSDQISCVLPVYNEAPYLTQQVQVLESFLKKNHLKTYEILLVDNGSTDGTWNIITRLVKKNLHVRGLRLETASYGQAVKHGLLSSLYPKIVVLNVDLIDTEFIKQSVRLLQKYDIVVGSKTLSTSRDHRGFVRKTQTKFLQYLLKTCFGYTGTDTHGLKAFRKTALLRSTIINCAAKHELFDTELLIRLTKQGALLKEIPITISEIRPTRYVPWRRIRATIIDVYRIVTFWLSQSKSYAFITGDDFGRNIIINKAIIDQALAGTLDAISVLVNQCSPTAAKKLKLLPKKTWVGLHLNFVQGKPTSPQKTVVSLVNKTGSFYPLPIFLLRLLIKKISVEELIVETKAQLQRAKQLSINIVYVDSEQHTHVFPPVWNVVNMLAKENSLMVRSPNSTKSYLRKRPHKWLIFWCLQTLLKSTYSSENLQASKNKAKTFDAEITHPGSTYD